MVKRLDETHYKCERCGELYTGDLSKLQAENCEVGHEIIIISMYDFELPGFISFFNTGKRQYLSRNLISKIRNLKGRALRGHS